MGAFGFDENEATFRSLVSAYSEKQRHYHTLEHVADCLRHLDTCVARINEPNEVELALWFHDAIYNPLSGKNERKSADWAASFLSTNAANVELAARVHRLIMVTEHNAPTHTNDESILVDIDLSILGADSAIYNVFEQAVRKEYRIVPIFLYRKKRPAVLKGFLERPFIYQNEPFKSEREQQARVNLANAISNLTGHA
jgi:predicted metal-dependent HD superfamily phosphohydrolase